MKSLTKIAHKYGINACELKALKIVKNIYKELSVTSVLNIGGGQGKRWPDSAILDALYNQDMDFNTKSLPYANDTIPIVVCEQVIEHLHNTTWFLSELFRIIKPGGSLILATENLCSIPNIFAMLLQNAPFSTQPICGNYLGGWQDGLIASDNEMPTSHPTFSGTHGHVRVMTVRQLKQLFVISNFQLVSKHGFAGNHYVLFHLKKTYV